MDDLLLIVIVGLGAILFVTVLPWIVLGTARLLAVLWSVSLGSVFQSYSAAGARLSAWQYQRDLRAQAAGAFRSSSFRSSAWGEGAPDREVLQLGALLQKVVSNCNAIHH